MTVWQAGRAASVSRWVAGLALTSGLLMEPAAAAGADLTRYRTHALESSVADVVAASQARASEVVTVHERPARIQVLEWRTPYAGVSDTDVDPVKGITFGFLEGRLYQMTVTIDTAQSTAMLRLI